MKAFSSVQLDLLYKGFKYFVYSLLTLNIILFFQEESLATQQTFSQGITIKDIIQGFAATIDTAAWVLLLLLFELETAVLQPNTLSKPRVKISFALIRVFSYGFIIYAFYGYISKMLLISGISPYPIDDVCALIAQNFSTIDNLDEYPILVVDSCSHLNNQELFKLNGQKIIGTADQWSAIQWLTRVDVINSITWIMVVLVLEADVRLQQQSRFEGTLVSVSKLIKILLYTILFAAATYWGFLGDFLDFWDAFMWLVAFFFIEMNLFKDDQAEPNIR